MLDVSFFKLTFDRQKRVELQRHPCQEREPNAVWQSRSRLSSLAQWKRIHENPRNPSIGSGIDIGLF